MTRLVPASALYLRPPYTELVAWHLDHATAICLGCNFVIGDSGSLIYNHLSSYHRCIDNRWYEADCQVDQWKERQKGIPFVKLTTNMVLKKPIEGLKVVPMYECGVCKKMYAGERQLKYHCLNLNHDVELSERCEANTFKYGVYLPIKPPPEITELHVHTAGIRKFVFGTQEPDEGIAIFFGKDHPLNLTMWMDGFGTCKDGICIKAVLVALNLCLSIPTLPAKIIIHNNYDYLRWLHNGNNEVFNVKEVNDGIRELQGLGAKDVEIKRTDTTPAMQSFLHVLYAKRECIF